jgi:hypothetical protein
VAGSEGGTGSPAGTGLVTWALWLLASALVIVLAGWAIGRERLARMAIRR